MTPQAHRPGSPQRERIDGGWEMCATAPGRFSEPGPLAEIPPDQWLKAPTLGPAADQLRALKLWSLDGPPRRFDADDWWYRVEFERPDLHPAEELWLGFDGLATVADVWLNGQLLMRSTSMFVAHEHSVRHLLKPGTNQLVLRFHSLDALLAAKRPRPRWRAPMVANQQLRWTRTTLLGRTPGWSPPAAVVGPTKDIWWERRSGPRVTLSTLRSTVEPDATGKVAVSCLLQLGADQSLDRMELEVTRDGVVQRSPMQDDANAGYSGAVSITDPALWWPHTHGEPALYQVRVRVFLRGVSEPLVTELGSTGFRTLQLDTSDGRFALRVNGVPVFCRGACWTPLDVVSLRATPEATHDAVAQARDAGMNMLRVGGSMVYEEAAFFDGCDSLGVLVWQEFMFANMDYPEQDGAFMADVHTEVQQQLQAWQGRPSLAVLCGNSEGEQQAAMWGASRELWSPPLFHTTLRERVNEALPDVPYWPSSAHGGAFPHQGNVGTTSYYGVGAYLRAPEDARRCELKFATECLAFANVPDERTVARMPGGHGLRMHHPQWKERSPRDLNAGWDFEDVRDHYLSRLFRVDPVACRTVDHERYLALSRVVTGELMAGAFAEWRRPGSGCGGALVWFLRDLWAGAGWGLVDDTGLPKACFYALRRALQPVAVAITDEGNNGLYAHVINEPAEALTATLEITLHGPADSRVGQTRQVLRLPGRGQQSVALAEGLEGFSDLSYAYRFGQPGVTLVHASLCAADGAVLGEAFHFPTGLPSLVRAEVGLTATLETTRAELLVASTGLAQHVHIALDGYTVSDNDFHLAPGSQRRIALKRNGTQAPKGQVWALNADRPVAILVAP
ncbi:MAG: glycoside hydrolase family 2 protein [Rhizobacter sp.]|nr:glycoside hydrolase family 2 protein [Rhizobacter sp.]